MRGGQVRGRQLTPPHEAGAGSLALSEVTGGCLGVQPLLSATGEWYGSPAVEHSGGTDEMPARTIEPMADAGEPEEDRAKSPPARRQSPSGWWVVLLACGIFIVGALVTSDWDVDNDDDEPSQTYEACAAAMRANGLTESDAGFLTAVGQCMNRLENPRTTAATTATTLAGVPTGQLSRAEACRRFSEIVANFRLTDQQSAVAFRTLAQQTSDRTLAAAIQRVGDAFARNAPAISSTEVQGLCR